MKNNENADRPMLFIVYVASSPFRLSGKAPQAASQSIFQKLVQNQHTSLIMFRAQWEIPSSTQFRIAAGWYGDDVIMRRPVYLPSFSTPHRGPFQAFSHRYRLRPIC